MRDMSFFKKISEAKPEGPFMEHPTGEFDSAFAEVFSFSPPNGERNEVRGFLIFKNRLRAFFSFESA
jgi:hypothetical protein